MSRFEVQKYHSIASDTHERFAIHYSLEMSCPISRYSAANSFSKNYVLMFS